MYALSGKEFAASKMLYRKLQWLLFGSEIMFWSFIWYWLLTIFTVSDIITTKVGLASGGHEANPAMALIINNIIEVKLAYLVFMIGVILVVERFHRGSGWIPVAAGSCVTFVAVISNVIQCF